MNLVNQGSNLPHVNANVLISFLLVCCLHITTHLSLKYVVILIAIFAFTTKIIFHVCISMLERRVLAS